MGRRGLINLHAFVPRSYANGPGARAVVWVQGCTLRCPGCFNPATHSGGGGFIVTVEELAAQIVDAAPSLEGLTISGGEPLQQLAAVTLLLREVRARTSLSTLLFTGFTWDEVQQLRGCSPAAVSEGPEILSYLDAVVAGRYEARRRQASGLRSSSNQTVHFLTERYAPRDFEMIPCAEVILAPDGTTTLSGVDPLTHSFV